MERFERFKGRRYDCEIMRARRTFQSSTDRKTHKDTELESSRLQNIQSLDRIVTRRVGELEMEKGKNWRGDYTYVYHLVFGAYVLSMGFFALTLGNTRRGL